MTRVRMLFLCGLFSLTCSVVMPADLAQLLESFLDLSADMNSGAASKNALTVLAEADFYKTGELTIPFPMGFGLVVRLGGPGAGSPLISLPVAERPLITWGAYDMSTPEARARMALLKLFQNKLFSAFGDAFSEGSEDGKDKVDFFSAAPRSHEKKHPMERIFNFKITPGMIWFIKLGLLVKHAAENARGQDLSVRDHVMHALLYAVDFGLVTMRLLRAWRRDGRSIGGISAVIEEKMPPLAKMLRTISAQYVPEGVNPERDELFLHNAIDKTWRLVMDGDGIQFGPDGSVVRGLGMAVSAIEFGSAAEAARVSAFLNQPQINWDSIEQGNMKGKSFIMRAATLAEMFGRQLAGLPDAQRKVAEGRFRGIKESIDNAISGNTARSFGRFELDVTSNVGGNALMKDAGFLELVGPGKALSDYGKMPCVVQADKRVYYCTTEVGAMEAGRLAVVVLFQALWKYLDAVRGGDSMGADVTKKIKEIERCQESVQRYIETEEASFMKLPMDLLLERPTVDHLSMVKRYITDPAERQTAVNTLIRDVTSMHEKAAARIGNIYRKALNQLNSDSRYKRFYKKIDMTQYPELAPVVVAAK